MICIQKLKPYSNILFITVSAILFANACKKDGIQFVSTAEDFNIEDIEVPQVIDIDIDNDGVFEFMSGHSTYVSDGPNYTGYGIALEINSLDKDTFFLLRSNTLNDLFLTVGDTITVENNSETFWDGNGISYAVKEFESTNDFEHPDKWDLYTTANTNEGIIAYKLLDTQGTAQLGWISIKIDEKDGTVEIINISPPQQIDKLVID